MSTHSMYLGHGYGTRRHAVSLLLCLHKTPTPLTTQLCPTALCFMPSPSFTTGSSFQFPPAASKLNSRVHPDAHLTGISVSSPKCTPTRLRRLVAMVTLESPWSPSTEEIPNARVQLSKPTTLLPFQHFRLPSTF